jgi:glycosyltransferase involved in cell wall biosynthesis
LGKYLEDTILSVVSQYYPNLEYIIIDGGSTDNSLDIIKKYESKLTYWVSEPDKGMYHAIQKGFEKSTGELMAWINSDDKYHPGALSIISEIFAKYANVNWLTGSTTHFDKYGRSVCVFQSHRWSKYDYYTGNYGWIQQESTFWRRSLWKKSGGNFNLEVKYAGDFELWLRFFRYEKLYFTKGLIGGFRVRESNQISLDNYSEYINEVKSLLKSEKLSKHENKVVNYYNLINSLSKCFGVIKLKKVSHAVKSGLKGYLEKHYYEYPQAVDFDRFLQEFVTVDFSDEI